MRGLKRGAAIAANGLLWALVAFALLALPGVMSDRDSTTGVHAEKQVRR